MPKNFEECNEMFKRMLKSLRKRLEVSKQVKLEEMLKNVKKCKKI